MHTGDEYFDSKEFRDILTSYEESVKSGQPIFMDADDLTDIADYYNYTGNREKARNIIDFALEISPGATTPLVFKAREALENEDIETAEAFAEDIIDKEDPDYKYLKAEILIAQRLIEDSETYLHEYFKTVEPEEHDDFVLDATNLYLDYGISDKAYEWMMRAKDCNRPEYKELLARTMFSLGNFNESARLFDELIDHNPYSKRYWNALASAQFMNEDFTNSVTSSEYAIAIDPDDPDSVLAKANGLYRLSNYEEALKYYERYCALVPNDELGILNHGTCLVNLARYEEALKVLDKALELDSADPQNIVQVYQEMAFAYSAIRMPDKAVECIDMTDSMDCDHIDMEVLRGHILLENGLNEEAEAKFQKAIIDSKNAPNILLRIMVSLYDNKYFKTAYAMFKKFFRMTGDDFNEGYSYMALCCWDMKRMKEFMHYLKIAVERNPKEAKIVLNHIFPKEIDAKDYYNYMYKILNNKEK